MSSQMQRVVTALVDNPTFQLAMCWALDRLGKHRLDKGN